VAQHRNHPAILQRLAVANLPTHLQITIKRIFDSGIPQLCNASATESNFQAFFAYGNHKTSEEDPNKTVKALLKDNSKGYTILFDPTLIVGVSVMLEPHY
jgi:hypothetical protein